MVPENPRNALAKLGFVIDSRIGGVRRGSTLTDFVCYVNTTIQQAYIWQISLVTAKVDIKRMFARVPHKVICKVLRFFDVPAAWINVLMAQLVSNTFRITTIRGDEVEVDLNCGLVEGATCSVLIIGLLLTYFLQKLRSSSTYNQFAYSLPSDDHQPAVPLGEIGWIDDWVLFTESVAKMQGLLELWSSVLRDMGVGDKCEKA